MFRFGIFSLFHVVLQFALYAVRIFGLLMFIVIVLFVCLLSLFLLLVLCLVSSFLSSFSHRCLIRSAQRQDGDRYSDERGFGHLVSCTVNARKGQARKADEPLGNRKKEWYKSIFEGHRNKTGSQSDTAYVRALCVLFSS